MIAIGVLLGAALIGYGVWRMTAPEPGAVTPAKADAPTFRVVTAARSISRGQVVSVEDLQTTTVLGAAPPGALTAPADAVGKVAVADIQPQQLVLSSLISADPAAAGLALLVPIGQRVISVDTTDEIAVAGFLRPGDIVDIELVLPGDAIATRGTGGDLSEARTLLQNIQVMTVGASLGGAAQAAPAEAAGGREPPARNVTLAMRPDQVSQFILARRIGRFYFSLRHPNDQALSAEHRARIATIRGAPTPAGAAVAPVSARSPAPPRAARPIELVVGGQRQVLYPGDGR